MKERLNKVRSFCEQGRQAMQRLEEMADELGEPEENWEPLADGGDYEPAAEFIRAEMLHNGKACPTWKTRSASWAGKCGPPCVPTWSCARAWRTTTVAERSTGFTSPRSTTVSRCRKTSGRKSTPCGTDVLHVLLLLVMCPEREIGFWRCRQRLLESPGLWPLLAGKSR